MWGEEAVACAYELQPQVCGISALAEVLDRLNFVEAMICVFKNCIHLFIKRENYETWACLS